MGRFLLWFMYTVLCAFTGLMVGVAYPGGKVYESRLQDARVAAYEEGLTDGMRLGKPADCVLRSPLDGEPTDAAGFCVAYKNAADRLSYELEDYQRTEAANRENARAWGWNDGYAQGRTDWRVQPECP
jgi:hypothetical protein